MRRLVFALRLGAITLCTVFATPAHALVISQIYGGGGNSGAVYTHDFIELFNDSATAVNLGGLSMQYTSASGSSWQLTPLSGILDPWHYFLVEEAAGSGGTTALPAPDLIGGIALSAASGKVALVNGTASLGGCSGPQILDLVGYGGANCFEGAAAAPGLSNTLAALRLLDGLQDTEENGVDFIAGTPAPRNSAVPANVPAGAAINAVSAPASLLLMLAGALWLPRRRGGLPAQSRSWTRAARMASGRRSTLAV